MAYVYPISPAARAFVVCGRVILRGFVAMAAQALWVAPAALAVPPALAGESPGQTRLRQACDALEGHESVFAKLHLEIDLFDQQLIGNGVYRQGPPETDWMSLDLKLMMGNQQSVVQQRCDGYSFWRCDSVDNIRVGLSRVDLARLRNARDDGRASRGAVPQLGLGGLPKLLKSLDQAFELGKETSQV
ncbi:MAG TPA: hypothetical protein VGX76_21335, partial [Pirellulales bacterium]|nr:hypothetical protein [Pirellulales bacterium]